MKYLKYFESKSDMQFHLEQIEDLFMDVVDEFGIYKRDREDENGLFYNIKIIHPVYSTNSPYIRIWIANLTEDPGPYKLDGNIKHSKVLRDFENRLRSIGYVIDRGKGVEYYEINIYLDNKRFENLKQLESSENLQNEYYLDLTKSIFQEVIDEFDLYENKSFFDTAPNYKIDYAYNRSHHRDAKPHLVEFAVMTQERKESEDIEKYINDNIVHRLNNMNCTILPSDVLWSPQTNSYSYHIVIKFPVAQLQLESKSDTQYYLDITKSIFQEVIDEFDLYENKSFFDDPSTYEIEPLVYAVGKKKTKPNIVQFGVKMPYKSQAEDIEKYIKDNILPRLNNMNCEILSSGDYKIYQSNLFAYFIVIEFPVDGGGVEGRNAFILRDKLQLESRQSDTQFHMDQINDLFMDVVDEFGVHRRTAQVLAAWDDDDTGLFYNIERWEDFGMRLDNNNIRLWFGEFIKKFNESIFNEASDLDYHKQAVRDVFQELFDEYDMDADIVGAPGKHYLINHFDSKSTTKYFFLWLYEISSQPIQSNNKYSTRFLDRVDLSPYYKRLENMGYKVDVEKSPAWIKIIISFQ